MNNSSTHDHHQQKYNPQKHTKKRLTEDQVSLLESNFDFNKKLQPERKLQLSKDLGIPPRQIAIWYQNKRARWKNQTLELEYNNILMRLQATLADKKQLQKEVERLRHELHWAHVHLAQIQSQTQAQAQYPLVSSFSNCYNEGGSSSDFNDEVLQIEEMYAACLMGDFNGSSNYA